MKTVTRKFHSDPGHGWLEVPEAEVKSLGINVSPYSYRKGDMLFLEEDCDASAYIAAQRAKGVEVKTTSVYYDASAPIRNYDMA